MKTTTRLVLGVMGGIGAGKSTVARLLAEHGPGRIVDADQLAHQALAAHARDGRLEQAMGPGFVGGDGAPDRKALAARVFLDPVALRTLERLVHPAVQALVEERIHEHRRGEGPPVLALDVPLLIEVGLDRRCDALWFVDASEARRLERAAGRGLSAEEVHRREANQSPLERKRARADLVIRNDGPPEELEAQVLDGLAALGLRPPAPA